MYMEYIQNLGSDSTQSEYENPQSRPYSQQSSQVSNYGGNKPHLQHQMSQESSDRQDDDNDHPILPKKEVS